MNTQDPRAKVLNWRTAAPSFVSPTRNPRGYLLPFHLYTVVSDSTTRRCFRFLENFTDVREPNISDWRRNTFGDLTAAIGFRHHRTDAPAEHGAIFGSQSAGTDSSWR